VLLFNRPMPIPTIDQPPCDSFSVAVALSQPAMSVLLFLPLLLLPLLPLLP
jgi:hypothetical protein